MGMTITYPQLRGDEAVAHCPTCDFPTTHRLEVEWNDRALVCGECGETTASHDDEIAEAVDRASGDYRVFIV